ncbi:hypothetical protein BDP27DRAFT_1331060 [Rhodocollybia butyracea]|uniref:Uncharacterized protein n=1 Tax=Rhodocollybia butyracea TaxID=206335 RepID=A0A9P5U4Q6_9AGAR|nr:hypothetical protein BDP27DRAFT_1331060 [Rhodocollybia butyracea]
MLPIACQLYFISGVSCINIHSQGLEWCATGNLNQPLKGISTIWLRVARGLKKDMDRGEPSSTLLAWKSRWR